jgi:HK97 family phage major capsid protein/HK97 family phage prohead protease
MRPRSNNPFITTRDALEELLYRSIEIDRSAINEKERTVSLSFSSETPVERWFGSEVLGHESGNVRMNRLENGAALLMDHDRKDQVGVVETATIDKDRKGRAVVRFSRSARGEEIFQDVKDGIRRLVSVGYRIHKQVTEKQSGGVEVVRVTDWEPYELSIVAIPADDTVGVGRGEVSPPAQSNYFQNQNMNRSQLIAALRAANITFQDTMTDDELRALLPAQTPAAPPSATRSHEPGNVVTITREAPPVTEADLQRGIATERTRIGTINAIANQARAQGLTVDEHAAITAGHTPEMFRETVLNALCARTQAFAPGTQSRQEARDMNRFSIARGIQLVASGRALDGVEREMHEEALTEARNFGLGISGQFAVPMMALQHGRRDLTATGGTNGDAGGNTITTTHGAFIELLYNKLSLRSLGTQFLTNLQGNFALPKMLTGTAPAKATENAALGESSPTTGLVNFSPKRAGRFVEYSKQLVAQSPLAWEGILRGDLSTMLAILMETAAINGGGSDEPTGILQTNGIGSVAGGTDGLALTRANAIRLKTLVASSNALAGSLGFLTNSAVRGKAQETAIDSGSGLFLWKDDQDDRFMGYRAEVSESVPSTLTKGSSGAVCSAMIFGNFADSILAQWGGIDFTVNPYIKDTEGLIRITADCFYDFGIRRAASFAAIKDLLTA